MRSLLIALCLCGSLVSAQVPRAPGREIDNVAAFARLYGVVRFFYPSDAAAPLDWNRFAIDGVARVRTAADANALAAALRDLFVPLGEGIEIAPVLTPYRAPAVTNAPLVAWRYLGAGAADSPGAFSPYAAKRTNRVRRLSISTGAAGFVGFAQAFAAQELRGRMIRLRGQVRATVGATAGGGALWLRVDRGAQGPGLFDNMGDRLVRDADWREYSIAGLVDADATNIVFGVMSVGSATADFDALELEVREADGTWRVLPIKDGGFEADDDAPAWGRVGASASAITHPAENVPEGRQFVRFAPVTDPATSNVELFADRPPALGDHIDVDLGAVKARVALTLTDAQAKVWTTPRTSPSPGGDLDGRLGDVVVAWNFYRHFYPYFTEAAVDWDGRLRPQLQSMYEVTTRSGELEALRRLVAEARDGHGRVADLQQRTPLGTLPLQLARVESRVVVIATSVPADVPVGAVVTTIDGANAADRFDAAMRLASGSTAWKEASAGRDIALCSGTTVSMTIDIGTGPRTVQVPCRRAQPPLESRPQPVVELAPRIWYVDLTRARTADLASSLNLIATAEGVIFDVRGYPTDAGAWILPHLVDAPEHDRWMHVSKITGPFGQSAGWQDLGWDLAPMAPKLAGKIVFLTDGRAISYAESVMGYIRDRHLGTIVGSTTAGTNGNVAPFSLPGGFTIAFTGMRVTGHDGQAIHHLVGVAPDIPSTPTIAGLREGRDEVLKRALSLLMP